MSWLLLIPGIAIGLTFLSIVIELLMHDRQKAKEVEFSIKRKQREMKKYQKDKDTKAMMTAQKELMGLMGQNFRLRMKSMLISFPLFIIIFFFLSSALSLAPLAASGAQVGLDVRNIHVSPQNVDIELVSPEVQVVGDNKQTLELDDKGDQGDRQEIWWDVTSTEGSRQYSVKLTTEDGSEEIAYTIVFSNDAFMAGFEPAGMKEVLNMEVTPKYKPVDINLFGFEMGWFIYYFIAYIAVAIVLSPLKNRILWGHWKGVKHLEKLDNENNHSKNETAKE